jgi:hypothetical protein
MLLRKSMSMSDSTIGPEAREWLTRSEHPAALASNRFESTEDALNFVGQLYELGARRVFIPKNSIRDDGPEGEYADSLVIDMGQPEASAELAALYVEEAEEQGLEVEPDNLPFEEDRYLLLWWD